MAGLSGHLRGVANCDRSVISLVRQRWVGRIRGWLEREAVSFMGHRSATRDFNDSLPPRVCCTGRRDRHFAGSSLPSSVLSHVRLLLSDGEFGVLRNVGRRRNCPVL